MDPRVHGSATLVESLIGEIETSFAAEEMSYVPVLTLWSKDEDTVRHYSSNQWVFDAHKYFQTLQLANQGVARPLPLPAHPNFDDPSGEIKRIRHEKSQFGKKSAKVQFVRQCTEG